VIPLASAWSDDNTGRSLASDADDMADKSDAGVCTSPFTGGEDTVAVPVMELASDNSDDHAGRFVAR